MEVIKKVAALFGLGVIAFSSALANAATPPSVFKGSDGNVYVHSGLTSGSKVDVELVGSPLVRRYRAGYCGQLALSTSTSLPSLGNSVTINGTNIDLTSISTTSNPPSCTSNSFDPPTSTAFKTGSGRIVLPGYTAGMAYDVTFNDLPSSGDVTANSCSFAVIRNTATRPLPASIKINGTSYTVASLTVADPPLCRRDTASGVSNKYIPANW